MIRKLCFLALMNCLVLALREPNVVRAQTAGGSTGAAQAQKPTVLEGATLQTQKNKSSLTQTSAQDQKEQLQSVDQKPAPSERFVTEQIRTIDQTKTMGWSIGPKEEHARVVSAQAQNLIQQSKWQNAHSMLEQAGASCGEAVTEDAKSCRAVLSSATGYLKLQQSTTMAPQSPQAQMLLQSAAESYAEASRLQPTNGPELNNLSFVYAKLGRMAEAEDTLKRAAAVDRGRTAVYSTRLGELQAQQKQWAEALDSYQRAAIAAPGSALPARRILDVYRRVYGELPASRKSAFVRTLGIWETTAPELARSGYEFMILRPDATDPDREQLLLRWTGLLTRAHELTPDLVQGLTEAAGRQRAPTEVMNALSDLSSYLRSSCEKPATDNWWMKQNPRRTVLASVALTWGQDHQVEAGPEVESGPRVAERCWQNALKALPVGAESGFSNIPGALQLSLDLRLELSSLYDRFPELDPQGGKAKSLVGDLFFEKMQVISAGDLEAEQRYHTVLGILFARRKQWTSGNAANAVYQLQHALEIADKRYKGGPTEGFYEPLPELRALLAEALWNATNHDGAAQSAMQAAMAYMDTDDFDAASRWLETAHARGAADLVVQQLSSLLSFRRRLVRAGSQAGEPFPEVSPNQQPWLFQIDLPSMDDFLKRQRFKVFADLAAPPPTNQAAWNADPIVQAYKIMLDRNGTPLIGATDLRRWEKVSGILLTSLSAEASPTQLAPALTFPEGESAADFAPWHHIPSGDNTLLLTLPGDLDPSRIQVSSVAAMAWRVVKALDAPGISAFYQFMQIDANGITIRKDAPRDKIELLQQQLKAGGVAVRVQKSDETA
jgi:tetratricopeptide (TPR) repeat protein